MSDSRIWIMPDTLANQIAAGEVVERPASVVKELVENSLDAEATRIDVVIEDGGRGLLQVTDDGYGMTREEALLALRRHATSKVRVIEDLHAIGTLGFRGEALPSIASVSRFVLETRTPDALEGTRVTVEGGAVPVVEDAGVPVGTRITVSDLFYNVPARRKFLRAVSTEAGRVSKAITRFSLGYPHVRFSLTNNGRRVVDLAPERSLRNRVFAVLGKKIASRLYPVALELGVEVEGLISEPTTHRPNADGMATFVNGRFIRDRVVQHAITSAYGSLLDRGRYPYVVLFVRVPPDELDVNVHPAKAEVRFVHSGRVHEAIVRALKLTLAAAPWVEDGGLEDGAGASWTPVPVSRPRPAENRSLPLGNPPSAGLTPGPDYSLGVEAAEGGPRQTLASASAGTILRELEIARPEGSGIEAAGIEAINPEAGTGFFSRMRYVGQVARTFLVCETDDAMHIIDQHAAHERVTYERLRAGFAAGDQPMQGLLFPEELEVSPDEVNAVEANEDRLAALGFEIARFGPRSIVVHAVPALLAGANVSALVRDLVAELHDQGTPRTVEDRVDAIAARLACHSSVRGGDTMTQGEVRALLTQLDEVNFRANCPHGRPVIVTYALGQVARWFERS